MLLPNNYLPFWHFFHRLEKELSYERWIDKYKLFLHTLHNGHIQYDEEGQQLLVFCKMLYLQDSKDEVLFVSIFTDSWRKEKEIIENYFKQLIKTGNTIQKPTPETPEKLQDTGNTSTKKNENAGKQHSYNTSGKKTVAENITEEKKYYINRPELQLDQLVSDNNSAIPPQTRIYNFMDEYLPISRREMAKGWQYFRHYEKGGVTGNLNIPATVKKIAREMLFTEPEFEFGRRSRRNTFIIFADMNGSMVPFHELNRRIIIAAKNHVGAGGLQTYYFQNFPLGYVYEKANLTQPVKIAAALALVNKANTTAIIISDAGFARAYGSDERFATRTDYLKFFLKDLEARCSHTAWLNPMPQNRWHLPTVEYLKSLGTMMLPIVAEGLNPFQQTLKNLFKMKEKFI